MPMLAAAPAVAGAAGATGAGLAGTAAAGGAAGGLAAGAAPAATGMGFFGAAPAAGASVTPAGLGSGAIGTGFTGPQLAASGNLAPAAGGFGPGIASQAGPGSMWDAIQGSDLFKTGKQVYDTGKDLYNIANSVNQTFGPQGTLTKGDLSGTERNLSGLARSGQSIGARLGMNEAPPDQSNMNLDSIPPEVKAALIAQMKKGSY